MAINVVARKLLWGRAGDQCAMPECFQSLTIDLAHEESEILAAAGAVIGEEAHIRSSQPHGPRHDPTYPTEKLDTYENLLLLCPTHHAMVDKNGGSEFSVGSLGTIKRQHEARIAQSIGPSAMQRRVIEERMTARVLLWEQKVDLDNWVATSGQLNMPVPVLTQERYNLLHSASIWLFEKKWPRAFPKIVGAFHNLDTAFGDLTSHVSQTMAPRTEDLWEFDRVYKHLHRWDPSEYDRLFKITQEEKFTLYGLVIETTKALNYLIDCIIEELDSFYRFDTGVVLMRQGDGLIQADLHRTEYSEGDAESGHLFPGIDAIRRQVAEMIKDNVHNYEARVMFHLNSNAPAKQEVEEP
ncbi:hypothetical protein [Streptomyces mirabilis]|uniref:hypothetical protein n=1 Tax=Streptomyces mirabilis TaxID=68239 RepID=UPI0036DB784E